MDAISTSVSPPARSYATMAFEPFSGKLLLTEGSTASGDPKDSWFFDPGSSTTAPSWTALSSGSPDPARDSTVMAACALDAQHSPDRLLLFGGITTGSIVLNDDWIYKGSAPLNLGWGQVTLATKPPARFHSAMAFYPISGQDVLYGGGASGTVFGDTWNAFCGAWTQANPAHTPGLRQFHAMAYTNTTFNVVMFGGKKATSTGFFYTNETWTWGRRAACLPANGSQIRVGTTVACKFDEIEGVVFGGWSASGFAPRHSGKPAPFFTPSIRAQLPSWHNGPTHLGPTRKPTTTRSSIHINRCKAEVIVE